MGLISNRVRRESLRPGDHVYTWRACHIYAHHGIYVGDNKVIHYTLQDREPGTGTPLDRMRASSISLSSCSHVPRRRVPVGGRHGVVRYQCLDCFLKGGKLYRYEYSVNVAFFLAKFPGTCTRAVSDEGDVVVRRANYLLHNGFGRYNLFRNNCENFAVYCKTGLLVLEQRTMGQSGQMVGATASTFAVGISTMRGAQALMILASPEWMATMAEVGMLHTLVFHPVINICTIPALALLFYCAVRLRSDIGTRMDVERVSVEGFASMGVAMN